MYRVEVVYGQEVAGSCPVPLETDLVACCGRLFWRDYEMTDSLAGLKRMVVSTIVSQGKEGHRHEG